MDETMMIPNLEPYCNSWVILNSKNNAVCEIYSRELLEKIFSNKQNAENFTVKTSAKYLADFNLEIRQ